MLGNLVKHPNAGGVLVLGLGCENNTMDEFIESLGDYDKNRIKFLVSQEVFDEIEEGAKILSELYENMKNDKRQAVPLSNLKVGLKCGGSDGLSEITANPLVGSFSDFLVAQEGTTILTDVPEMFGAETILMNRAKDTETFDKITDVLRYGETLKTNGLNLLYSPGNDLVAASALAAAGCQIVLFTTGRGTPFVTTVKISTNTALFNLKPHWMDFNA